MFGKKKRKAECRVVARDASGAVLMDVAEGEFALPEDVTIRLSVEFFNDPQPCEIHRRAVAMRLYGEIIEAMPVNHTVSCAEVPPRISLCLRDVNPAYMRLEMK